MWILDHLQEHPLGSSGGRGWRLLKCRFRGPIPDLVNQNLSRVGTCILISSPSYFNIKMLRTTALDYRLHKGLSLQTSVRMAAPSDQPAIPRKLLEVDNSGHYKSGFITSLKVGVYVLICANYRKWNYGEGSFQRSSTSRPKFHKTGWGPLGLPSHVAQHALDGEPLAEA